MEPKTAPYGPQDGLKIDVEAILRGFDVRRYQGTIKTVWPIRASRVSCAKLGPWEEGREEGNPPHTVHLYSS